ncbi:hypothetical protein BC831DRAFT_27687 [Entophlyctis helioformis]|nr:hypothetical protein BC831DRAFT_27687 [Entophlyctis helioformis]
MSTRGTAASRHWRMWRSCCGNRATRPATDTRYTGSRAASRHKRPASPLQPTDGPRRRPQVLLRSLPLVQTPSESVPVALACLCCPACAVWLTACSTTPSPLSMVQQHEARHDGQPLLMAQRSMAVDADAPDAVHTGHVAKRSRSSSATSVASDPLDADSSYSLVSPDQHRQARRRRAEPLEQRTGSPSSTATADVARATPQPWQDACQSVDDETISSRLDVPSLDLAVASLTQDQQQQLVAALISATVGMLRDVAPKHIGQLPDPAGSTVEQIRRRLFPNPSKPGVRERRPLTEDESRIQREDIQLILQHGTSKYTMLRCSEQLDEWMAHPDAQQWSCKQFVLLFAA